MRWRRPIRSSPRASTSRRVQRYPDGEQLADLLDRMREAVEGDGGGGDMVPAIAAGRRREKMVERLVDQAQRRLRGGEAHIHLQGERRVEGLHQAIEPGAVGLPVVSGP